MRRLLSVISLLLMCQFAFAGGIYIPPDTAKDLDIMWTVRGCPASQAIIDRLGAYGIPSANILCADMAGTNAILTGRSATASAGTIAVSGAGSNTNAILTGSGIAISTGNLGLTGVRNVSASLSGSSGSALSGNLSVSGVGGANAILAGSYGQMSAGTLGVAGQRNVGMTFTSASAAVSSGTLSVGASGGGATDVSDNFNRANASSLGANWTQFSGTTGRFYLNNYGGGQNYATTSQSGTNTAGDYWSANAFNANHYSETSLSHSAAVRMQSGSRGCYYVVGQSVDEGEGWYSVNYILMKVVNGGTPAQIGSTWNYQSGGAGNTFTIDNATGVLRLEANGTTITLKSATSHGGTYTTRITTTDSALSGGSAGIYDGSAAEGGGVYAENWYGGDL